MARREASDELARRARAWHHAGQAVVCDVATPWAHGTVLRATRHPDYYDFNLVRVEEEPAMGVEELARVADEALEGLAHRRLDFEVLAAADRLRGAFEARAWRTLRLVTMRHDGAAPAGPAVAVEEVPYDAVHGLRVAWHREDFPDQDPGGYHDDAREVARLRGARVFAVREAEAVLAYAQLEHHGQGAEITQVYVDRGHRGGGLGTAITRAAIAAAGPVRDLWIAADDEDRPKELYARLGFRAAWRTMEFTLLPQAAGDA